MPSNAVVTGWLWLAALFETERQIDAQARQTAIRYEIPLGQLVHAFCLIWEKLPRPIATKAARLTR